MSIEFDGTNDEITKTDESNLTFGSGNFTIMCWVNKKQSSASWDDVFAFTKWNHGGSANTNEWAMSLTSDGEDDKPEFYIEDGSTTYNVTSDASLTIGTWYHLAARRDGDTMYLYVNGVQKDTRDVTGVTMNDHTVTVYCATAAAHFFYTYCILEECLVYGRALTANEIATHYATRGGYTPMHGCNLRWPMREEHDGSAVASNDCKDITPNNYNGSVSDSPTYRESVLSPMLKRRAS
jgi:hypothetical protein